MENNKKILESSKKLSSYGDGESRFSFLEKILAPLFLALTAIYFVMLIFPIISMIRYSGGSHIIQTLYDQDNIKTIILSFVTSLIALIFTFIIGTPTAFCINFVRNKVLSKILDIFVEIPVVLPPAVAGIALLLAFGKNGVVGNFLSNHGINVIFTSTAVIIAQFFVSSALYVRVLRDSVKSVPIELFEVSYVLGAGKIETIIKIMIPMLKKSIVSGLILAWIRSLGEFGATLMFAGNIIGKTRTIPLQIYTYMQDDIKMATAFATILYIMTFVLLLLVRLSIRDDD
ncbi:putative transport system permease protein NifC [Clostridium pasteurianum DSM 525 = ATCC 6013]|uniref:Probable transport system permease protein NifC n=3 Tax=Clostridium pasteurianum TaxID=1501 RepID=NIFC_CLOPA|nr:ABC transporter permease [Clostridium pasteurianum]P18795.1 RecName: Full=Probable transport system permease protein NifC [Clostridium pasteurianum]AAA23264.1 nitrogenase C (nifC) [Clostridium pasteurianum]AAT37648.1 ModB [Clostridium pasteurianum]AJA47520.1 putative transport system permease protein NifC [Clostridium pasteurianum DSM 525 = ATCC 6013]AJA51508.1 putative transport system permease protein NifC [Clostridium pasteurianum DSM 525 = ATCC 6013]AOZ74838.1 molybdenum ABC transporte